MIFLDGYETYEHLHYILLRLENYISCIVKATDKYEMTSVKPYWNNKSGQFYHN